MEPDVAAALITLAKRLDRHSVRLEERLDGLALTQGDIRKDVGIVARDAAVAAKQSTDTNGRVRELEKWRSYLLGGMTVVTFTAGIAAGYVVLVVR